jgi:ribonucleotide reductase alpha subunit
MITLVKEIQRVVRKRNTIFVDDFSKENWENTYQYKETDKDINDTHLRVAVDLSSVEETEDLQNYWADKFADILENFTFVPGGRITSNAGTGLEGTTYINCYVSSPGGEYQDSMEGILRELRHQALILKSEGGYGFCADFMRPRGSFIHAIGNETPGAVEMLRMWDTQSAVITQGSGRKVTRKKGKRKIRKGAQMVTMSCWHPDIEEFITKKQQPGVLTKFNMSILVTDDFMKAVKHHRPWSLEFPDYEASKKIKKEYNKIWDGNLKKWKEKDLPVKVYKEYEDANELWDLIMESTYSRNEPGILFVDTINRMNNLHYCEYISASNPCLTGDTLVYVSDGRGMIPISQLAEEGKDVPVFCYNNKQQVVVRQMRNPRVTGHKVPVYKVTLDDGSVIRATSSHKFLLKTKTKKKQYKAIEDLQPGDSLNVLVRYEASFKDIFKDANSNSQDYLWINNGQRNSMPEHRLIAAYHHIDKDRIPQGYVVHHKDYNAQNNTPNNLKIMTKEAHDQHHSEDMFGDKNPMKRAIYEWSEKKWGQYRQNRIDCTAGPKNGKWIDVSNETLKDHALILTKHLGYRFSEQDWQKYAKERGLPSQFSKWRNNHLGGMLGLAKWAALELGLEHIDAHPCSQKEYKELTAQGYNCEFTGGILYVIKSCEVCGTEIRVRSERRECSICSNECRSMLSHQNNVNRTTEQKEIYAAKSREAIERAKDKARTQQIEIFNTLKIQLDREPMRKEWGEACKVQGIRFRIGKNAPFRWYADLKEAASNYNHKVVSVEFDGYEDVYNGTVDEYHNFFVGGFESKTRNNKKKWYFLNNLQCGEQVLPPGGVCLLGSLNLTQFIDFEANDWDYEKLANVIPIAIRFMDNVNDHTNVPLEIQRENLQNKRRIGLGILGYGSALIMLKIRYGSEEALAITEKLMSFIMNTAYQASALLAKEKGAFPLFDKQKYLSGKFISRLSKKTRRLISQHGLRNSHLLSIQPTGNSSVFANNVSGGLEPVFLPDYIRTTIQPCPPDGLDLPKNINWDLGKTDVIGSWEWTMEGDENILITEFEGNTYKIDSHRGLTKEVFCVDYGVRFLKERGEWDPRADWASSTDNLTIEDHINTLKVFATYLDSACSKTVNLSHEYPYEDFKRLYIDAYDTGVIKGCTTYREGTTASVLSADSSSTKKGGIIKTDAPSRPEVLPCDIHHPIYKGEKWLVMVGLWGQDPYEIFAFRSNGIELPKKVTKGVLTKRMVRKRGKYDLECDDGLIIKDVASHFAQDEEETVTRCISMALRHGVDVEYAVDQLLKSHGTIASFNKVIARTLKKYINGTLKAIKCLDCGSSNLKMTEGCFLCCDCGTSKCQ